MAREAQQPTGLTVEDLIESMSRKLRSNKGSLEKSLHYGRLVWRQDRRTGKLEIDLELKL